MVGVVNNTDGVFHGNEKEDGDGPAGGVGSSFHKFQVQNDNKRFKLTPPQNNSIEEIKLATLMDFPTLGLKLDKSQSLVSYINHALSHSQHSITTHCITTKMNNLNQIKNQNSNSGGVVVKPKKTDYISQAAATEKLKASNFPATFLKIGSWKRVSRYEGDLVAKCYYAKRKLVWEFLERSLKRKIEIQWADILAIKATMQDNEPGILEIELNQPPQFFHETDPQPRKHTNWKLTSDFTGGEAPLCRRHYVSFPPGILNSHYAKLLQCDSRLFELSQKPYPSLNYPYFHNLYGIKDLSFIGQIHDQINPGLNFSHPHVLPVQSYEQMIPSSLLGIKGSVLPESAAEHLNSQSLHENAKMGFWIQGVNNFGDTIGTSPPYQNNFDAFILRTLEIGKDQMDDSHQKQENHPDCGIGTTNLANREQEIHWSVNYEYPSTVSWVHSQDTTDHHIPGIELPRNDVLYQMVHEFADVNYNNNGANNNFF